MRCSLNDTIITHPRQMKKPITSHNTSMTNIDRRNKSKMQITDSLEYRELVMLEKILSSFVPGSMLLYKYDKYVKPVSQSGRFMYADRAKLMPGEKSQCHRNTINLYQANIENTSIATGYAWVKNNLWVEHSWLIHWLDKKRTKFEIVETTIKRNAYFGKILNEAEAEEFIQYCYS